MKKRLFAIISIVICFASLLSCVGCQEVSVNVVDNVLSSESTDASESATEESATEKKTQKKTEKKTEKQTEAGPIPGVTKADKSLVPTTYNFVNMPASEQQYFKFLGRSKVSSNGLIFDNSCVTLEFQGYMTGDVIVEIKSEANGYGYGNSFFTVYVDGERSGTRFEVSNGATKKLTVASFEGEYFHTVKIVKQTEFKWSRAIIKSLEIEGYLITAPAKKNVYIEFLGDSLTTGYGNIGKPGDTPDDSPKFQDGTKSYAYLAAEAIDADYSMISRSAGGINQCWSNAPIIDYYKKFSSSSGSEAFNTLLARIPNLIVIHLGANDYNVAKEDGNISNADKQAFVNGGKALINYFRDIYGEDIPIIWAYDPGEGFPDLVKEIMNSFGGEDAGYYTRSLGWSDAGAGGHPSAKEHENHATALVNLITSKNIIK